MIQYKKVLNFPVFQNYVLERGLKLQILIFDPTRIILKRARPARNPAAIHASQQWTRTLATRYPK